jgi:hypothetical protein
MIAFISFIKVRRWSRLGAALFAKSLPFLVPRKGVPVFSSRNFRPVNAKPRREQAAAGS